MKLSKVVSSYTALAELAQTKMPVKAAFQVAKNLKKLETDYQLFQDSRKKIIVDMYIPDGLDRFKPKDEKGQRAIEDLFNLEVELTEADLIKISMADLGSIDVSPAVMLELEWMIIE